MTKDLAKNLLKAFIVSLVVAGIYMAYYVTIGIPKTQARNYFNLANSDLEVGDKESALKNLETAKGFWPEQYVLDKIEELSN